MAHRGNEWWREQRRLEIERRGGRCEYLYINGNRCRSRGACAGNPLEFAHLRPTGLNGRSRGSNHRIRDVIRHPDAYQLLCRRHHRMKDGQ